MPKQIRLDGVVHTFPDDFTDADIAAALEGGADVGPRPNDPTMLPGRGKTVTADPGDYTPASFGGFVANAAEDVGNILSTIRHPIDTVAGVLEAKQHAEDPARILEEINAPPAYSLPGDRLAASVQRVPGILYQQPVTSALELAPAVPMALKGMRAAGRGVVGAAAHPMTRTVASHALDFVPGATARATRNLATAVQQANAPAAPVANLGGRLVPRSTPSVQATLIEGLEATRAPVPGILAPSHPPGGGFTTPPVPSPNVGGRLVPRATPSVEQTLAEGLAATRRVPPVTLAPSHPVGGGFTVPPGSPAPGIVVTRTPGGASVAPQPAVTLSPQAQRAAAGKPLPREGVQLEQLYRTLARKPILTPQEQLQFEVVKRIVEARAQAVGQSFAAGGTRGIP